MSTKQQLRTISDLLLYGFCLTGPYAEQETSLKTPLDENTVLAYLRGMLVLHVATSVRSKISDKFDVDDQTFMALQFFQNSAGMAGTSAGTFHENNSRFLEAHDLSPSEREELYAQSKNRWLWGIGDALIYSLSALSANAFSPGLDSSEFLDLADNATFGLLAGHPKRHVYDFILSEVSLPDFKRSNFPKSPHRPLADYFGEHAQWSFWETWVEKKLSDDAKFDALNVKIALISDDIWFAGPQAVAAEIERIRAKFHLESEIMRLKSELSSLKLAQSAPALGHNQGPPLDENKTATRQAFDLIWPVLEDLEQEAKKPAPDPAQLGKLAQQLWDISKAIAKYCGGLVNTALTKSAETIGETGTKWVIRTGAVTYVGTNEGVQSVAKAAWQFAKVLSGG